MSTFNKLLVNALISGVMNSFLWFAVTFWVYLETESVLATSVIGGAFAVFSALFGMVFGTFVDRHRKGRSLMFSAVGTLVLYGAALVQYAVVDREHLLDLRNVNFWVFVALILAGSVVGNLRAIAMSTLVTLLVPEDRRDKANGMLGTVFGLSFSITSVLSGLVVGQLGMGWAVSIASTLTGIAVLHLITVRFDEPDPEPVTEGESTSHVDFRGAIQAIAEVPGLYGLIFFMSFNNLLGGVFMALMDAYGLSLVSVEAWGLLFGVISFGFIAGGLYVARRGLGSTPMRLILRINLVNWTVCALFTLQSSITMLAIGMLVWITLIPVVEAAEQTVLQKAVPFERQGRVFGFAQTVENAASPLTSFMIGPLAQLAVIPFMTDGGAGADAIGGWFGTGRERGIALIFTIAGLIGVAATFAARASNWYAKLSTLTDGPAPAADDALAGEPEPDRVSSG